MEDPMSTEIPAFERSLHETHVWLNETTETLGGDKQRGYHALRAVLHALRDRLTVEQGAHFAAQLPMLLRGIYYEGWQPAKVPEKIRSREEFLDKVERGFALQAEDPLLMCRSVFRVLEKHVTPGELDKVRESLPEEIRRLWER
jgi:uncharacterized protein (DUF2267 family)